MKRQNVALYNPYLDVLGGGELHILSILKVLDDADFQITIFWDENLERQITDKFKLTFKNRLVFIPNIFRSKSSQFERLKTLSKFDYFFYVTDGSYFFSSAVHNFIFSMVPDKRLYQMNLLNNLKTKSYKFISNSNFTAGWLDKWGIKSTVIYPYLNEDLLLPNSRETKKDDIILSVGRFFPHGHRKNHFEIIRMFKEYKKRNPRLNHFKLILAGGVKPEDQPYFEEIKRKASDDPSVILMPNIAYQKLFGLYQKSAFYWHLTGYQVDENLHPELVEHLGIAPLEAMAMGCLTFCVEAGGVKEIVVSGKNGFLFKDQEELFKMMNHVLDDKKLQTDIRNAAHLFVKESFNYMTFSKRVRQVVLNL